MSTKSANIARSPMQNSLARGWIAWPGWLAAIVILIACWLPARNLPKGEKAAFVPNIDKIVHVAIFGAFGVAASLGGQRRAALAVGIGLAIVSELGQDTPWVGRDASIADASADILGLILGVVVTWLWAARRERAEAARA